MLSFMFMAITRTKTKKNKKGVLVSGLNEENLEDCFCDDLAPLGFFFLLSFQAKASLFTLVFIGALKPNVITMSLNVCRDRIPIDRNSILC